MEKIMETYIGCKIIKAEPLMKDGKEGYRVVYPDGYESWSPKVVFEDAYRPMRDFERAFIKDELYGKANALATDPV